MIAILGHAPFEAVMVSGLEGMMPKLIYNGADSRIAIMDLLYYMTPCNYQSHYVVIGERSEPHTIHVN